MARKFLAVLLALLLVLSVAGSVAANPGQGKALGKIKKVAVTLQEVGEEPEEGDVVPSKPGKGWGRVKVNGKEHRFGDVPPVIKDGRILIPVRGLMASLGADVRWESVTKTVYVNLDDVVIILKVDSQEVTVNGDVYQLDVPAKNENGRVVIPLRFIAEALGFKVGYDGETGDVTVDDPDPEDGEPDEDDENEPEDEDEPEEPEEDGDDTEQQE